MYVYRLDDAVRREDIELTRELAEDKARNGGEEDRDGLPWY